MELKKLFQVDIGKDEKGNYHSHTFSLADKTVHVGVADNLKTLLLTLNKNLKKKNLTIRKFPLESEQVPQEESRIIIAGSNGR